MKKKVSEILGQKYSMSKNPELKKSKIFKKK